jgi:site-specific recombinase XerD
MQPNSKLYLFKRSNGIYYIAFFEGNRRQWRSTKCRKKSDALHCLRNFEGAKRDRERTPTLSDLFARFEALQRYSLRPSTLETYRLVFNNFRGSCGDRVIDQYTISDIEKFKRNQIERGVSKVSVNIWFRAVKAVFGFAVKHDWLVKSPFHMSLQFPIPQQLPAYLAKDDFQKLLKHVNCPIMRDLYIFAALTGLRLSEIINLQWQQVNMQKRQITITNGSGFITKTGRVRTIPMHDLVFEILCRRKEDSEGYVFSKKGGLPFLRNYVSKMFKEAVREAGLPERLHLHSLRHTCASWLVDSGVSLYVVQNILGHASITTTQIYSHLSLNTLHDSINKITV